MKLKYIGRYIVCIVGIISLILILKGFVDDLENSQIYNYESQKIIEEYGDKIFPVNSITATDDKQKKYSFFLLCGIERFDKLSLLAETSFKVSMNKNCGNIKLLAANIDSGDIVTLELCDGDNELLLKKGEYQLYIVGKWFSGNVNIPSA